MTYNYIVSDYNDLNKIIFNIITGVFSLFVCNYCLYAFSFIYEFKQKEIIIKPFFGLFEEKVYPLKNIKKVELSINPKGVTDSLNIYFKTLDYKKKISISMFHYPIGQLRLFLYANIENFDEILTEEHRRFV